MSTTHEKTDGPAALVLPLIALATVVSLAACGGEERPTAPAVPAAPPPGLTDPLFVERTAAVGLDFVHFNGMSGELYIAEITCAGGGMVDVDGDGDLDLYLVQGSMLGPGKSLDDAQFPPRHPLPLTDRLYRNERVGAAGERGELAFTDVTAEAGLTPGGYGCSVTGGDFDNDGRIDLYIGAIGRNRLLRNLGGGRFADVTDRAGVGDDRSSVAATFFDYDRDGWLDLFVVNNVDFSFADPPRCFDLTGAPDYCGPGAFVAQPDRLYRNLGDGRFADVTAAAGLTAGFGPALGVVAADFDGDGWLDLYVANDGQPNNLWINRHDGTFEDQALLAGCAVNGVGESEASMGVDAADFDGDGDLDLILAHLIKETNTLYRNDGTGLFVDATAASGLGPPSLPFTTFGAGWLDIDNDGWLDLATVNGEVTHDAELKRRGDPFPLHQPNQLFRNLGDGRFAEITAEGGEALKLSELSRGAAFGDVDDDGDTDILVINNNGPARLLLNQVGSRRPWLGLRLVVAPTGGARRDALGARVALLRDGAPDLWRRVRGDGSYNSMHDLRVLFGLGDPPAVRGVRVLWPDGRVEDFPAPAPGRYTPLQQGTG